MLNRSTLPLLLLGATLLSVSHAGNGSHFSFVLTAIQLNITYSGLSPFRIHRCSPEYEVFNRKLILAHFVIITRPNRAMLICACCHVINMATNYFC